MSEARRPHVLIVGGFLTEPFAYRTMAARIVSLGAAEATIAPVHAADWLAAGLVGLGPLLVRTGLAIRRAHRIAGRRPLLVVGHSGGGILVRLAMAPAPLDGRRAAVADAVGCLVTLGTPHGLAGVHTPYRHPGMAAARFLDAVSPGAWAEPTTTYLTVGSTAVRADGGAPPGPWDRLRSLPFRLLVGPIGTDGSDGIVRADLVRLPGARELIFADVRHGIIGSPWYGDDAIVDRWWPVALELWHEALAARASGRAERAEGGRTTLAPAGATVGVPAAGSRGTGGALG